MSDIHIKPFKKINGMYPIVSHICSIDDDLKKEQAKDTHQCYVAAKLYIEVHNVRSSVMSRHSPTCNICGVNICSLKLLAFTVH